MLWWAPALWAGRSCWRPETVSLTAPCALMPSDPLLPRRGTERDKFNALKPWWSGQMKDRPRKTRRRQRRHSKTCGCCLCVCWSIVPGVGSWGSQTVCWSDPECWDPRLIDQSSSGCSPCLLPGWSLAHHNEKLTFTFNKWGNREENLGVPPEILGAMQSHKTLQSEEDKIKTTGMHFVLSAVCHLNTEPYFSPPPHPPGEASTGTCIYWKCRSHSQRSIWEERQKEREKKSQSLS